jgi:YidC/Oxa1 family membrane protein insertase
MNFFVNAFNLILYQPLFNALVLLYQYLPGHDFGVAVVVLTILIKVAFYPLGTIAIRSQKNLSDLQPKLKEIQQKYKDDKERQAKETMALYQREKINPFSGCLPLLIQLPILLALYSLFWKGLQPEQITFLYSFVANPGLIDPSFLGVIDLSKPNVMLALLAGISQFVQSKMTLPKNQASKSAGTSQFGDMMQKQMLYFFPGFTVLILWNLPSAIGLYWLTSTVFSIIQQYLVFKKRSV